jgi:hypothetical protein
MRAFYACRMRCMRLLPVLVSLLFVGCGDGDGSTPDSGPPPIDLGLDANVDVDGGSDVDGGASVDGGGTVDGGPGVDAGSDAGTTVDAGTDTDAGDPRTCVGAGGMCVPVVPGSCSDGVFAAELDCGGGLGVTCCLPRASMPECTMTGTESEGWYGADGTLICFAPCGGEVAECRFAGTRSEGWYTTEAADCPRPIAPGLIEFANCAP